MKKLKNYVPFHFLVSLIIGILLQYFTGFCNPNFLVLSGLILVLLVMLVMLFILKNTNVQFSIASWLFFFLLGIMLVFLKNPKSKSNYFEKFIHDDATFKVKVFKVVKPSKNFTKYFARITHLDHRKSAGNLLLNIKIDSLTTPLGIDDQLIFKSKLAPILAPKNPHQFNYQNYLGNQYIFHQVFLSDPTFIKANHSKKSLIGNIAAFRKKVKLALAQLDFSPNELSVINALLLGDKTELSSEIQENYAKAGAIHILAISGLHIGIVLLLFSKILFPLDRIKNGQKIKGFVLIILLWGFAIFTGLSASVVRATTMFSFVAIGQYFQKGKIIEHALVTAMFITLLFKPLAIFDVGFQLSYLAVFGIIGLQPKLQKLIPFKNYILQKIWQLFTVSISAQLAVFPLSIYYFHQFPSLFFLSNLVIVPCLGIILGLGFVIILLSMFNYAPDILVYCFKQAISLMNSFMGYIAHKESFVFDKLYLSFLGVSACYLLIISVYQCLVYKQTKLVIYSLIILASFQSMLLIQGYFRIHKEEFIVFHQYKKSLIGIRKGKSLLTNMAFSGTYSPLNGYEINEQVNVLTDTVSKDVYRFKDFIIIKIDSSSVYPNTIKSKSIILLTENPKINLERLIQKLKPEQIIADGSNYQNNMERWQKTCNQQKTPFYQTRQNGAYILQ